MLDCPYCDKGKVQGSEADPTGRKVYPTQHTCHKCNGSGTFNCTDADGKDLTLGDKVKMEFTIGNLHPRPDGGVDVEVVASGDRSHFAIVNANKLLKV